jgi:hypothetical protein
MGAKYYNVSPTDIFNGVDLIYLFILGPVAGFCEHSGEPSGSIQDSDIFSVASR